GLVVECTGAGSAVASFSATATNTCQPNLPVTCAPPSGSTFSLGVTTVTCVAVDVFTVTNRRSFTVTVRDTTPPAIICAPNVFVNADAGQCSASGVILTAPSVNDACGATTLTNNAPRQFLLGSTAVTWTATDLSGNFNSCTQTVTVVD